MANKKQLIDANEAKRRIIAFATGCHTEALTVDSIIMLLNQSDTVDAVEVVHGRWEYWTGGLERCSACGHEYTDYIECHNYCPNCGAKMDGGNEDDL